MGQLLEDGTYTGTSNGKIWCESSEKERNKNILILVGARVMTESSDAHHNPEPSLLYLPKHRLLIIQKKKKQLAFACYQGHK